MKFSDIFRLSLRNLREAKLRAGLTTMGVIVGVAVIVTMVSFGLGLQRNTVERFRDLDLFNEITVYGRDIQSLITTQLDKRTREQGGAEEKSEAEEDDEGEGRRRRKKGEKRARRTLDDAAIEEIARLPGVAYVEPNVSFRAFVRVNNHVRQQTIGGVRVPNSASRFRQFAAGQMIASDEADEAVVDETYLKIFGYKSAAEAVGQTLELLAPPRREAGSEAEAGASRNAGEESLSFFGIPLEDEKSESGAGTEEPKDEASAASSLVVRRFRIAGVLKNEVEKGMGRNAQFRGLMPAANVYVPLGFARQWATAHRDTLDEVAVQLARMSGVLDEAESDGGYESATVRVENPVAAKEVSNRLDELGFNTFSLFNQLDEIRTFFLVVNSALGLLGSISLLVAALGIANTMIMSILERTREIGIMKAIGAEDREIKLIFFVEAAVIGLLGGSVGALSAWVIDKLANYLTFKLVLEPQGTSFIDFFSLPAYLWLGAILFAMIVAILAALYPAARAARIDPVRALRHD